MPFPDVIAFLPLTAADSSRLTVLKSQYNRFAARLNAAGRHYKHEVERILK